MEVADEANVVRVIITLRLTWIRYPWRDIEGAKWVRLDSG